MSTTNRNPVELDEHECECEACGAPAALYTVATPPAEPVDTTSFALCPACALTLVDEIAATVPVRYLDGLVGTVKRRAARRDEREEVAS